MKYEKGNVKKKSFKTATQNINYFGINLTKQMKDLHTENYKTLIKETEMIQRNGKISHAFGLEELMLLKWSYYPKQSTDLM